MVDDDEDWANQYVALTARLADALDVGTRGGGAKRFAVADSLAEQLGFDVPSGVVGMGVLLNLVPELEAVLLGDPADWVSGINLPGRVVRAATADLDEAGLVAALVELGWSRLSPPVMIHDAADVRDALSRALSERLSSGMLRMLERWRSRGLWLADPRRPPPS